MAIIGGQSIANNLLSELGYNGWALQNASYNGCTFSTFVKIPIVENSQIYQQAGNAVAIYNQTTGKNSGSDPNSFGNLYNTILSSVQFSTEPILQVAVKQLPYSNRCNTEDLGTGGYEFKMTVVFIGDNYQKAESNFENAIANPIAGATYLKLIHPTKGEINGITRVTSYKSNTSLSIWNGCTVNVTFRSEQSNTQQLNSIDYVQQVLNTFNTGINAVKAIDASIFTINSIFGVGVTSTFYAAPIISYTTINAIQNSNTNLSKTLLNNIIYIYQSSNTNISNTTLSSSVIDYNYIPTSLNLNSPYTSAQGKIILQYYQNIANIAINLCLPTFYYDKLNPYPITPTNPQGWVINPTGLNLGVYGNDIINIIKESIATLYNICTLLSPTTTNSTYTLPYEMSIRQVLAFNNLPMSQASDTLLLNPDIPSANYIPQNFTVQL